MTKNEKEPLEVGAEKLLKEVRLWVRKFGVFMLEVPLKALKGKKIKMEWWFIWTTYILLGVFLARAFTLR
jgi:hypothetical protein